MIAWLLFWSANYFLQVKDDDIIARFQKGDRRVKYYFYLFFQYNLIT
jgi:hypothetical protein